MFKSVFHSYQRISFWRICDEAGKSRQVTINRLILEMSTFQPRSKELDVKLVYNTKESRLKQDQALKRKFI